MKCCLLIFAVWARIVSTSFGQDRDPFGPGSEPPPCPQLPWELLITQNVQHSGSVIRIVGWLRVTIEEGKVRASLCQTKEGLDAGFVQGSVEIELSDVFLKLYDDGNLESWKKLNGKPFYLTGRFVFHQDWLDGQAIGKISEPIVLSDFADGVPGIHLVSPDAKWPR